MTSEIKLNQILCGKSEEQLAKFPDNFFDGIVTDPPYGMGFMNQNWDTFNSQMIRERKAEYDAAPSKNLQRPAPDGYIRKVNKPIGSVAALAGSYDLSINGQNHFQQWFYKVAVEMLRTAKPGSFLLCFGGTRTFHRVVCALEDAGWIIKDQIMWLYGEGFPKSTNIGKQIDKEAGVDREVVGQYQIPADATSGRAGKKFTHKVGCAFDSKVYNLSPITAPATELAKQWEGYGTGLKPGWEPIIVAMKPLEKGLTYAQNAEKWGVAGLNIDDGRIGTNDRWKASAAPYKNKLFWNAGETPGILREQNSQGRWPANVILSHSPDCVCVGEKIINEGAPEGGYTYKDSEYKVKGFVPDCKPQAPSNRGQETVEVWACVPDCPIRIMDSQSGVLHSGKMKQHIEGGEFNVYGKQYPRDVETIGDSGGASRFFYCAKAKRSEREAGLKGITECVKCGKFDSKTHTITIDGEKIKEKCIRNSHPTVKPLDLMRYLINLIKMPNKDQIILDPFCGSGTTLVAAEQLSINYIGIDQDSDSCLTSIGRIGV